MSNVTAISPDESQSIRTDLCRIQDDLQRANAVLKLLADRDGPQAEGMSYTTYENAASVAVRLLDGLQDDLERVTARVPGLLS